MKNGVMYVSNLKEKEISEVRELIKFYNVEKGLYFKFDPGFLTNLDEKANHVLFYDKDMLLGYMSVDCYNGNEVEAAPIVDQEDIFLEMHQCLLQHAMEKGKKKLLYIVDQNFHFLENSLRNMKIEVSFSENRMKLNPLKFKQIESDELEICDATVKDKKSVFELDRDAFDFYSQIEDEHLIEQVDISDTKIATIHNETIGKVKVFESDGNAGIYGFVIYPHLRGKGYGKAFLSKIISNLMENGAHQIYLEVETENRIAVHLYQSIGFEIQSTFDYYALNL
ncbi:MAG: acetyltransferase family protein [Bacillales bacterium]|jgi:ribosomal protein S18 acetylase RimI-like enzyme|nr:acetyltransferase family protein [Bacillales bacterium]